jgi:hypothetical protein
MRFEVLGIEGCTAVRGFDGADCVVFNALTRYEYELPAEDFERCLARLLTNNSDASLAVFLSRISPVT